MYRDYICRIIERVVQAIARVMLHREAGQPELAMHEILRSLHHYLGLELSQWAGASTDELFQMLTRDEAPLVARDKCLAFAALNFQAGLIYQDRGSFNLAQPAFHLALLFTLRGLMEFPLEDLPRITPDVNDLLGRLQGYPLPSETQRRLEAWLDEGQRSSPCVHP